MAVNKAQKLHVRLTFECCVRYQILKLVNQKQKVICVVIFIKYFQDILERIHCYKDFRYFGFSWLKWILTPHKIVPKFCL